MTTSPQKTFHAALVGAPNCGKTSLFNALTGSRQKVANYPGVTVERKSGHFSTPNGTSVHVLDLPGTYSLRGRSPDEIITRDAVLGNLSSENKLDILVIVADSTNIQNALRLTLELKQTGLPLILALNMHDIALHRGIQIDIETLQSLLQIPVVTSIAVRKNGTNNLINAIETILHALPEKQKNTWQEPTQASLRAIHKETDSIIKQCIPQTSTHDNTTQKIDKILLHPAAGLFILFAILFVMFQAVFTWSGPFMDLITAGFDTLGAMAHTHLPAGLLQDFIQNGVIAGVGGVVIFLPQILILFLFILLLEDFGYMSRAAFLMDKIMGGVGLHGRAFIPLLSSFACAIPGIMATRVIDNKRDRLTTILIAPLMTCSARIPVYTLLIGAFIPAKTIAGSFNLQGLVMFGLYTTGILAALTVSFIIKIFSSTKHEPPSFMLEMPDYKVPHIKSIAIGLWTRAAIFLKRAGTTIFAMSIIIWFLASFPLPPESTTDAAINYSLAATIGKWMEPFLAPIGFNWQISVSLIPGMAAREVMVSALSTVYAVSDEEENLTNITRTLQEQWSMATAFAVLAWYIFAPQCAATLAVIKRELNSWTMMFITFFYMFALAYAAAFITYRTALALGLG